MTEQTALTTTKKELEFARADLQAPQAIQQATDFAIMCQEAEVLRASGFLPKALDTWQKVVTIMIRARHLEIDEWTAFQHLPVINGSPQPDGQLCLALILRSGLMELYEIVRSDEQVCTIRMKRVGQPAFDVSCTWAEYEKLAGPDGKRQPKTHLFWYTFKQGSRRLFSDVLNNMNRRRYDAPVVIPDDMPDDDDIYVSEEGEEVTPSAPLYPSSPKGLSLSPSVEPASSSADDASDDEVLRKLADLSGANSGWPNDAAGFDTADIPPVGALDMTALCKRALSGRLVKNEWHFGNLLNLLMREGAITERMTADGILDAMKAHKAAKEFEGLAEREPTL